LFSEILKNETSKMSISFLQRKSYLYSRNFENKTSSTESLSFHKGNGTLGHKLKKKN